MLAAWGSRPRGAVLKPGSWRRTPERGVPSKRHSCGSVRHCGEMHVPQPSSADGSVALTTSTVLCNHRHCDLVFFIVANRNSVPIKLQVPILPSPSPSLRRPASVNARSPGVPGKRTHTRRRLLASGAYCPRGSPVPGRVSPRHSFLPNDTLLHREATSVFPFTSRWTSGFFPPCGHLE